MPAARATRAAAKYEKAVVCLTKDRETLLVFFDFPAEFADDRGLADALHDPDETTADGS
ncbi:hypothetical protein V4R08_17165 (plasmid) [Nitrobacter sp. NHB1]|uniref:hypothetical protein n=1 Tax=Nitrobacter sp. NHB1 TaxID=3119830 RepID=UPI002FFF782A